MKDLYTFDTSEEAAFRTYDEVSTAYRNLFRRLEMSFLVVRRHPVWHSFTRQAEADSGNIGGSKSHEYHLPSQSMQSTLLSTRLTGKSERMCS